MIKSIYLNWLTRKNKDVPVPELVLFDEEGYGGYYVHPREGFRLIDGKMYSCKNGIIAVTNPIDVQGTLAHEWRHHIQFMHGILPVAVEFNQNIDYEDAIYDYFMGSASEMDAFLFEYSNVGSQTGRYWMHILKSGGFNYNG